MRFPTIFTYRPVTKNSYFKLWPGHQLDVFKIFLRHNSSDKERVVRLIQDRRRIGTSTMALYSLCYLAQHFPGTYWYMAINPRPAYDLLFFGNQKKMPFPHVSHITKYEIVMESGGVVKLSGNRVNLDGKKPSMIYMERIEDTPIPDSHKVIVNNLAR